MVGINFSNFKISNQAEKIRAQAQAKDDEDAQEGDNAAIDKPMDDGVEAGEGAADQVEGPEDEENREA
eukprot:scaffold450140_cov24-Prasinocladus_malaysianus.AAC.1